jgi:hypothetical protein
MLSFIFSDFCLQCWYFKYIWYILYIYYNCTRLIRTGGIYKCVLWVYCVIVDIIVQFRLEILSLRLLLCDMKDNILMNFMYIFVWILMFYLYLMHINHMSITFLSVLIKHICKCLLSGSSAYNYNKYIKCIICI